MLCRYITWSHTAAGGSTAIKLTPFRFFKDHKTGLVDKSPRLPDGILKAALVIDARNLNGPELAEVFGHKLNVQKRESAFAQAIHQKDERDF